MSTPERSLPLRVSIAAGESIDSWIDRLAHRNDIPTRQLLPVLGLAPGEFTGWDWLHSDVPDAALRRIERQSGLDPGRLDNAITRRYQPTGWRSLHTSRYCPRCLADGVWRLRWRLPWTFACTTHKILLPDRCPGCRQPLRRHISGAAGANPSGICTVFPPRTVRGRPTRESPARPCATDLTTSARWVLSDDDLRLHAQQWIDTRLDAVEAATATPTAVADLSDLDAVGAWSRIRATADDFTGYGRPTVAAFAAYVNLRNNSHRPARQAFTDPLIVAAVAVTAVGLLDADTPPEIIARLRALLGRSEPDERDTRGHSRPMTIHRGHWRTLSPGRQALLLAAIDPVLAPLDRLRFYSCTTRPRLSLDPPAAPDRTRWIPQVLWPEWVVRLTPPVGRFADTLREAIPCCLTICGSDQRAYCDAIAGLRSRWHPQAHTLLRGLPEPVRTAVLTAICHLADHLDEHGGHIDYQRRRHAVTTDLLSWDQWQHLCFTTTAHPGQDRRHLDARRYVYQILTGADLGEDHHDLTYRSATDRSSHLMFADRLTTPLRHALHEHARGHLELLGIDEPLTWAPDAGCVAGLHLPGRDPADIDLAAVHQLVLTDNKPVSVAADILATSIDHVRYALHTAIVRPPREWGPNAAPRAWHTQQRARALLTPAYFQREYVAGGKRLKQLQAETGFGRKMLADYAKGAGVQLADAREAHRLDEAWLRDQYLHRRRSFPAIAAELGISEMTVTRAAREYGISARTPGITSHPDLVTELGDEYPPDIRHAVNGQLYGWQRLRRFQQAMDHPSLNIAGRHLGITAAILTTQIQRLERAIGAPLIHRATVTTPMTPTARGAALLTELRRPHIDALLERRGQPVRGWKPDDPRRGRRAAPHGSGISAQEPNQLDDAPSDLRRAVEARNGWSRLHRFAAAMTYPTLTDAAAAISINIATLIEQLNRLEADIGARLFHRATPASQTQHPTARGTALLHAFAPPEIQALCPIQQRPGTLPAIPATRVAAAAVLPSDVLRAVNGQNSGWTRLQRYATAMQHTTITRAATAIGINRTTLIEQLHRLETDIGAALYHRATADGQAHKPTDCGTSLLHAFARADVQTLYAARTRLPRMPLSSGQDRQQRRETEPSADHVNRETSE